MIRIDDAGARSARTSVAREFAQKNFLKANINLWPVDLQETDGVT